jgi:hypothetical protein
LNGYGNNLANPCWGGALEPFVRLDVPGNSYVGNVADPASLRIQAIDPNLPNSRSISNAMARVGYSGKVYASNFVNQLHTEFSQFMIADITNTDISHFYGATCIPAIGMLLLADLLFFSFLSFFLSSSFLFLLLFFFSHFF